VKNGKNGIGQWSKELTHTFMILSDYPGERGNIIALWTVKWRRKRENHNEERI